jgi:hypothetical protein
MSDAASGARGQSEDDGLSAYGDAFDLAARAPTLLGVVLAVVASAMVWAWRRLVRTQASRT